MKSNESTPTAASTRSLWGLLIALMIPVGMATMNMSMFGVALPTVRDAFGVEADMAAWLLAAYSLPFVIFMPLYGKLGDSLGKARLFQSGIVFFFAGSVICLLAGNLPQLLIGRILQGVGTAGYYPLCIAIIAERFPPAQRGRAMGTWSSVAPGASTLGPLLGGFAVDHFGWNYVFLPSLLVALIALWVAYRRLPSQRPILGEGLQAFDWLGAALLGGALVCATFYLSSRTITGVEPLRDWRLLAAAVGLGLLFWRREGRIPRPLVSFSLYRRKNFGVASLAAGCRMVIMHTAMFLNVLFLTDVYGLDAIELGIFTTIFSGAIFATTQLGGQLSDRMHCRWLVVGSFAVMISALAGLALFALAAAGSGGVDAGAVVGRRVGDGCASPRGDGGDPRTEESGSAAGLYSTARFGGGVVGATVAGRCVAAGTTVRPRAGSGLPVGIRRGRGDQSGESGGGVEVGAVNCSGSVDQWIVDSGSG